jgi:hypothetical protein
MFLFLPCIYLLHNFPTTPIGSSFFVFYEILSFLQFTFLTCETLTIIADKVKPSMHYSIVTRSLHRSLTAKENR